MKRLFFLGLAVVLAMPFKSIADGMFVVPKFVWDKHKDINEPTQKAILVYDAGREDLILQVKYEGPLEQFGWLIPVPNQPNVQKGSMKCFYELSQYTQQHFESERPKSKSADFISDSAAQNEASEPPVKVVEIKTVGAYEVAVLSSKDPDALEQWLQANQFYFPTNKTDVIDWYVQQHWYFIAVRINFSQSTGFQLFSTPRQAPNQSLANYSTELKLASGELNPLQISFASDRCVFPLKISSVNGQPSEVQVYILCPEPLLEKTMLEKKLPLMYSNDMTHAAASAKGYKSMMTMQRQRMASMNKLVVISTNEINERAERMTRTPRLSWDELLNYAKVTQTDLPDSTQLIPRLASKSWWLTKQTWTFTPDEMRDLTFQPAIPVFEEILGSTYGYIAVENLAMFQSDSVPALVAALQSTNPAIRLEVASHTDLFGSYAGHPIRDSRMTAEAAVLMKDPESVVRTAAVNVLANNWNPQYKPSLVEALTDEDPEVRGMAGGVLGGHPSEVASYIPHFQTLLKNPNPGVRAVAFELLRRLHVPVSREDLLGVFQATDAFGAAWGAYNDFKALTGTNVSDEEDAPLLRNASPSLRLLGLDILYQNADKQAVELALPLLKDAEPIVRERTAATLRALTGQHFTVDQADEWQQWWARNKNEFIVVVHPEELRPQGMRRPPFDSYQPPPTEVSQ